MPWSNQGGGPWGSGGGKGPWGSGPQSSGPTPPDLEELLRRSQDRLRRVLPGGNLGGRGFALLVLGAVLLWGLSGFFRVEADERASLETDRRDDQPSVVSVPRRGVAVEGEHLAMGDSHLEVQRGHGARRAGLPRAGPAGSRLPPGWPGVLRGRRTPRSRIAWRATRSASA